MLFVMRAPVEALAAACDAAFPCEACGFLLGRTTGDGIVAVDVARARSSSAMQGEFEICDDELRRIRAWSDERSLEIVALFHSHPSGERSLSVADRAALAYSEWPWLVVTRSRGGSAPVTLTGYRPRDARPLKVQVERALAR